MCQKRSVSTVVEYPLKNRSHNQIIYMAPVEKYLSPLSRVIRVGSRVRISLVVYFFPPFSLLFQLVEVSAIKNTKA